MKVVPMEDGAVQTKPRPSMTTLRKKNILTVPREIADRMHLAEGDEFIVSEEQGRIVLTPVLSIPADQAWFWTQEWQARVAEAEVDRIADHSTVYASEDEFLTELDVE
jgi:AbrB family looped-hinge helix DNA binding protein